MNTAAHHRSASFRATLLAFAAGLVPFLVFTWRFNFLTDDSFIAFRYSKHLAEGYGLRYNLDNSLPVEGYSEFLWVVLLAAVHRAGLSITTASRLISAACGAILVVYVTAFCRRRFDLGAWSTAAAALFFGTLPPIAVWSTGGMATMPATLAIFATYERWLGDAKRPHGVAAGLCALVACLLRADSIVWVFLIGCAAGGLWLRSRDPRLLRASLVAALIPLSGLALHTIWRYAYYADLLPNTARIKAGFSTLRLERGLRYVVSFFLAIPSATVVLLSGLWLWRTGRDALAPTALAILAGTLAYSVYVGGDFMTMGRFIVPALPFLAMLFAGVLKALGGAAAESSRAAWAWVSLCIVLSLLPAANLHVVPRSVRERFHFRWNDPNYVTEFQSWRVMQQRAQIWSRHGRALKLFTMPGESIILGAIGAIGFYSDLRIYDRHGLTDREVAMTDAPLQRLSAGHDKRVPDAFFFKYRPTYLTYVIAPASAPLGAGLGTDWNESEVSRRVIIETHQLPQGLGFLPGEELRLLRFRWTDGTRDPERGKE